MKGLTESPTSATEVESPCLIDVMNLTKALVSGLSRRDLIKFVLSFAREMEDEFFSLELLHGLLSSHKTEYDDNVERLVARQIDSVLVKNSSRTSDPSEIEWEQSMSETMSGCIELIENSVSWNHFLPS
jgi:hypothetical protein